MRRLGGALLVVLALAAPAVAEVVPYKVSGEASTAASDPRTTALDDAFAAATRAALVRLVTSTDRSAQQARLDREVVGRARRWVASFTVGTDRTVDDRRVLEVTVQLDLDKLSEQLRALGIAVVAPAGPPVPTPGAAKGTRATLLVRVTTPAGMSSSYGASGTRTLDGIEALGAAVSRHGWTVVAAPASGPAARADGELPLDLEQARALAGDAKASFAVVVGATASAGERVRGTTGAAASARATVQVVDVAARASLGPAATATGTSYGADGAALSTLALERAIVAAFGDAVPARAAGAAAAPTAQAGQGEVLLAIARAPVATVDALVAALVARKSTRSASVRRLGAAGVVVAVVTSESAEAVGKAARAVAGVTVREVR